MKKIKNLIYGDLMLTVNEIAADLKLSTRTIYRRLKDPNNKLKYYQFGEVIRVKEEDYEEYKSKHKKII